MICPAVHPEQGECRHTSPHPNHRAGFRSEAVEWVNEEYRPPVKVTVKLMHEIVAEVKGKRT